MKIGTEQMSSFYRTDIEVPAELIVDGKVYPKVGVHFRGTSSYFTVGSEKKSFNIAVDYDEDGRRLYGYKTLNLLNGHVDASFLREVLYNQISRDYIPAMKTNLVKLVINGENWGVYINLQQYNKDFLAEWFGTRDGIRWKIGPGRGGALNYAGDDPASYEETYQLKTRNVENPWEGLIALTKMLDDSTPDAELVENLPSILNIDQVLWQLAVSNVFMDDDGYIHKGGDYTLYQDVNGRFHLVPHDNNESLRFGRSGRGGPGGGGPGWLVMGATWKTGWYPLSPMKTMRHVPLLNDCFQTQSGAHGISHTSEPSGMNGSIGKCWSQLSRNIKRLLTQRFRKTIRNFTDMKNLQPVSPKTSSDL